MRRFERAAAAAVGGPGKWQIHLKTVSALGAWLFWALLVGLGVSPVAIAQTTVTYIHTDALGSVVAESDANGNVIKRYDYEPYGAVTGGQITDGPGYTGHVSDSATGLSYMQQRYLDPQLGVFLSVDPVTAYEQPVGQFNRYRYANGNPYRFVDPDGRIPVLVPIVFGITAYLASGPANAPDVGEQPVSMPVGEQISSALPPGRLLAPLRMAANAGGKTYTTYTRQKADGTTYSGRTSGKGTPEAQVSARTGSADHRSKTAEGYGPAQVDRSSENKSAIRGREQQLIDQHGGARSSGGTSGNEINGVSPTNPKAETYRLESHREFGS